MRVEAEHTDAMMDGESHLGRALIRWEPPTGRFAATTFADDFHLGSSGAIGIRGHCSGKDTFRLQGSAEQGT